MEGFGIILITAIVNLLVGIALSSSGFLTWAKNRLFYLIRFIKRKILREKD